MFYAPCPSFRRADANEETAPKDYFLCSIVLVSSLDDATASPHSSASQAENSFCAIMLMVNETVH